MTQCIICDNETQSHYLTEGDDEALYACHDCWERRTDPAVEQAFIDESILPVEAFARLLDNYIDVTDPTGSELTLGGGAATADMAVRTGSWAAISDVAGVEYPVEDAGGPFTVIAVFPQESGPATTVHSALLYLPIGDADTPAYTVLLCIGNTEAQLRRATEEITETFATALATEDGPVAQESQLES